MLEECWKREDGTIINLKAHGIEIEEDEPLEKNTLVLARDGSVEGAVPEDEEITFACQHQKSGEGEESKRQENEESNYFDFFRMSCGGSSKRTPFVL